MPGSQDEMQSAVAFPEMLHRGSSAVFELGFVGDWVGGWGMVRMWVSMMCCLIVAGKSSPSWVGQNGHDSSCGMFFSSSPEWTALSLLSSSLGMELLWVGVIRTEPAWLDGLGGGLLVGVELLSGEVVLSSELCEVSESARIPNLLLGFHILHAF